MSKKQRLIRELSYGLVGGGGFIVMSGTAQLGEGEEYVSLAGALIGFVLMVIAVAGVVGSRKRRPV